ncbi:MAG TPA: N-acetylglucosamine-6-phosphate deacetylase [Acidimicrobiia bacterium]|nr:N-acetylglucosamine-6-phosphate deacetylase [Acidimicrobiia bacterium]
MPADGMLDLQVNGYAGVDFNADHVAPDDLHAACLALREDGVAEVLLTIITDELGLMCRRLRALAALREADPLVESVVAGFHVEGPFINPAPGYVGAHPAQHTMPASTDAAARLLEAGGGLVRLVTLAPECDPGLETTARLVAEGVTASAGHCDPSRDQLEAAIDHGLSAFTHLGNGCPASLPRHDNIIQRVLSLADQLMIGFIPDGAHVPYFALRNYLRCAGTERCFFVSDAISAARLGPGRYTLAGWTLDIGEDLVARMPGGDNLVGSTVTCPRMKSEAAPALGLGAEEFRSLTVANPRRVLGGR